MMSNESNDNNFPMNLPYRVTKWRHGEPTRKPCRDITQDFRTKEIKANVGETIDAEISNWHNIGSNVGVGYAFILPKNERRGSLYIRESDVITTGEIHVGTLIRCIVAPPSPGYESFEGKNIQIYQDEFQNKGEPND
jgi:hypothetical protein